MNPLAVRRHNRELHHDDTAPQTFNSIRGGSGGTGTRHSDNRTVYRNSGYNT